MLALAYGADGLIRRCELSKSPFDIMFMLSYGKKIRELRILPQQQQRRISSQYRFADIKADVALVVVRMGA